MSVDSSGIRSVLRAPQVRRILLSSQVGRLPTASGPLALLLFARQSLSLATAGLVVAGYTAGMAVGTPLLARAVDRWRQPPVLWGAAVLSGLAFGAVALTGGDVTGAVLGAAVAGFGTPPLEACLRTLWPSLLPPTAVPTAYALDIAVQEVIFVVGPLASRRLLQRAVSDLRRRAGAEVVAMHTILRPLELSPHRRPAAEPAARRWPVTASRGA